MKPSTWPLKLRCLALIPILAFGLDAKPAPFTVSWRNKPPYHYLENGKDKGFLLERSKQVFAMAGIEAEHVEMPTKRILQNFNNGTLNFCSIGWYYLPEREALFQYSKPLHIDPPRTVIVGPAALAAVKAHGSLASLLQDGKLSMGIMDGVSYGQKLDTLFAVAANRIEKPTVEPFRFMHMAAANRFSFALIDREDWDWFRTHEKGLGELRNLDFADMPGGIARYLVCSKDVSPEHMGKLNRAIASLKIAAPETKQGAGNP